MMIRCLKMYSSSWCCRMSDFQKRGTEKIDETGFFGLRKSDYYDYWRALRHWTWNSTLASYCTFRSRSSSTHIIQSQCVCVWPGEFRSRSPVSVSILPPSSLSQYHLHITGGLAMVACEGCMHKSSRPALSSISHSYNSVVVVVCVIHTTTTVLHMLSNEVFSLSTQNSLFLSLEIDGR